MKNKKNMIGYDAKNNRIVLTFFLRGCSDAGLMPGAILIMGTSLITDESIIMGESLIILASLNNG